MSGPTRRCLQRGGSRCARGLRDTPAGQLDRVPSLRRAWVLCAVLMVMWISWQVTGWGGSAHKTLLGDLFFMPMNLAAVGASLLAARRASAEPRVRRCWQLFAVALTFYLLGGIIQTYNEVAAHAKPFRGTSCRRRWRLAISRRGSWPGARLGTIAARPPTWRASRTDERPAAMRRAPDPFRWQL